MYDWTITFEAMPGAFPIGSEPLEDLEPIYAGTILGNNSSSQLESMPQALICCLELSL